MRNNILYVIDANRFEAQENQRMYRVQGTKNVYRMICKHGIATAAELRSEWAWVFDPKYYKWINREDTIFY